MIVLHLWRTETFTDQYWYPVSTGSCGLSSSRNTSKPECFTGVGLIFSPGVSCLRLAGETGPNVPQAHQEMTQYSQLTKLGRCLDFVFIQHLNKENIDAPGSLESDEFYGFNEQEKEMFIISPVDSVNIHVNN